MFIHVLVRFCRNNWLYFIWFFIHRKSKRTKKYGDEGKYYFCIRKSFNWWCVRMMFFWNSQKASNTISSKFVTNITKFNRGLDDIILSKNCISIFLIYCIASKNLASLEVIDLNQLAWMGGFGFSNFIIKDRISIKTSGKKFLLVALYLLQDDVNNESNLLAQTAHTCPRHATLTWKQLPAKTFNSNNKSSNVYNVN